MRRIRKLGYNQKLKDEVIKAVKAGSTVHQTACHFKVSDTAVYAWLRKEGIPTPCANISKGMRKYHAKKRSKIEPELSNTVLKETHKTLDKLNYYKEKCNLLQQLLELEQNKSKE